MAAAATEDGAGQDGCECFWKVQGRKLQLVKLDDDIGDGSSSVTCLPCDRRGCVSYHRLCPLCDLCHRHLGFDHFQVRVNSDHGVFCGLEGGKRIYIPGGCSWVLGEIAFGGETWSLQRCPRVERRVFCLRNGVVDNGHLDLSEDGITILVDSCYDLDPPRVFSGFTSVDYFRGHIEWHVGGAVVQDRSLNVTRNARGDNPQLNQNSVEMLGALAAAHMAVERIDISNATVIMDRYSWLATVKNLLNGAKPTMAQPQEFYRLLHAVLCEILEFLMATPGDGGTFIFQATNPSRKPELGHNGVFVDYPTKNWHPFDVDLLSRRAKKKLRPLCDLTRLKIRSWEKCQVLLGFLRLGWECQESVVTKMTLKLGEGLVLLERDFCFRM